MKICLMEAIESHSSVRVTVWRSSLFEKTSWRLFICILWLNLHEKWDLNEVTKRELCNSRNISDDDGGWEKCRERRRRQRYRMIHTSRQFSRKTHTRQPRSFVHRSLLIQFFRLKRLLFFVISSSSSYSCYFSSGSVVLWMCWAKGDQEINLIELPS